MTEVTASTPAIFKLHVTKQMGGWCYASIQGEIDVANAPMFKLKATELLEAGHRHIVLNLDELNFIDSVALGILIGLLRKAREMAGDIVIVCNHPRIEKLFSVTGLHRAFRMLKREDELT
ncbi:MAG: STAS domain-containing protein [Candidatus Xenobia bacterium]